MSLFWHRHDLLGMISIGQAMFEAEYVSAMILLQPKNMFKSFSTFPTFVMFILKDYLDPCNGAQTIQLSKFKTIKSINWIIFVLLTAKAIKSLYLLERKYPWHSSTHCQERQSHLQRWYYYPRTCSLLFHHWLHSLCNVASHSCWKRIRMLISQKDPKLIYEFILSNMKVFLYKQFFWLEKSPTFWHEDKIACLLIVHENETKPSFTQNTYPYALDDKNITLHTNLSSIWVESSEGKKSMLS